MIQTNVKWGVKRGLTLALIFVAIASVAFIIGGEQSFAQRGVRFSDLIGFYLLGGLLGGLALGLLRPLARTKIGIVVISMAIAFTVWSAFLAAFVGISRLQVFDFLTLFFVTIVCGPFGAAFYFTEKTDEASGINPTKRSR